MTVTEPRRMGRPPKTSRDQILDAASICEPAELQLTTLASQLGISVKTVYYYFPTRKALLDAISDRGVEALGLPDVAGCATWREVLTELARWASAVGFNEPGFHIRQAGFIGPAIESTRRVIHRLVELGWQPDAAMQAYVTVSNWATATGEAARTTQEQGGLSEDNVKRLIDEYAELETQQELAELFSHTTLERVYEQGMGILLSGIESELL